MTQKGIRGFIVVFEHDYVEFPELTNKQINEFGFSSPHEQIVADFSAVVVKVIDGDTVRLRSDNRDFTFPLRLLDIDAPEMNEGGEEARDWLKNRVLNTEVQIKINPSNRVGKFGRLLGKIFHNGMDLGQEMFYLGLVSVFGMKDEGVIPDSHKLFRGEQWF